MSSFIFVFFFYFTVSKTKTNLFLLLGSLELLKEISDYLFEFLQCTVTSHVQNGDVFIRLGATNCLLNRILHTNAKKHIIPLRSSALMIYEELMLNNGGEELMPNLLENMHHAYADLKINVSSIYIYIYYYYYYNSHL